MSYLPLASPASTSGSLRFGATLGHGSSASGSSVASGSSSAWFTPVPSPNLDAKGKGRAFENDGMLGPHHASTRSFDRSRRLSVDIEGLSDAKKYPTGLGLDLTAGDDSNLSPTGLSARTRAPLPAGSSGWRAPRLDNPWSRLTRRRVSPGEALPLTSTSPSRSFSNESTDSSSSAASTSSSVSQLPVSLRLQRASRIARGKRKRADIEATVLYAGCCICALVLILFLGSKPSFGTWDHPQVTEGSGLENWSGASPSQRIRRSSWLRSPWRQEPPFAPERDTLVLYRILGNDLPPRHTHGQTLRNVRFMLENEHQFTGMPSPLARVEKYYVLNRIASEETVVSLLSLLSEFEVPSAHILYLPFEWDKYAEAPLQWSGGVADYPGIWDLRRPDYDPPSPFDTHNTTGEGVDERRLQAETMGRLRAIDYTYHHKNQYAINNNGGRNFALVHGRSLPHARWILPLDGNCFFTPSAMATLISTMMGQANTANSPRFAVIPMTRLLNNDAVLYSNQPLAEGELPSAGPAAPEEPQIGFRFDTSETYQSVMRYGRRSKLELLWRLGAVSLSRDLHRRMLPWETSDRQVLTGDSYRSIKTDTSDVAFVSAGWVYRLFSGDSRQELHSPEANILRNMNRVKGIVAFLERLDEILVRGKRCPKALPSCGFSKDLLWSVRTARLATLAWEYKNGQHAERVAPLLQIAERAKESLNRMKSNGTLSHLEAHEASYEAAALAFAGYITSDTSYTLSAAHLVRWRFYDEDIKLLPVMSLDGEYEDGRGYAFPLPAVTYGTPGWQQAAEPSSQWPADFDATQLLDVLRLLSHAHVPRSLRKAVGELLPYELVQAGVSAHLARLLRRAPETQSLEDGASYDLQIASLASAVDDVRLLGRVASRAPIRLQKSEPSPMFHRFLDEGLQRVQYSDRKRTVDGRTLMMGQENSQDQVSQLASWGAVFEALQL